MGGYSELIKNFDKTRDYVRDFFIYGFKVRGEVGGKSSRTYDDEKRRIESWLGGFMSCTGSKRGKQVYISADSGHLSDNPLYNAYYSRSFTDNDIKLHFMLCDLLADHDRLTARELTELLETEYHEIFDEQTVRGKLREYAEEGIFICGRDGRNSVYSLSRDTLESFLGEYEGLVDALKFYSGASEFGVIGSGILRSAGIENDLFLRKHNYIVHTLEDEVLLDLLRAISNESSVEILNSNGKRGSEINGVPLRIYVSAATGRRYVIMYLPEYKRFNSFRLDSVKSVKETGRCAEAARYLEKLRANESKVYGVSFGDRHDRDGGTVRITFYADEENERFIIDRLEREKRCGAVERIGQNLFVYTVDVFDTNEMMGWVKSFIGRIVSVEGLSESVADRFRRDIRRMRKMYCDDVPPDAEMKGDDKDT